MDAGKEAAIRITAVRGGREELFHAGMVDCPTVCPDWQLSVCVFGISTADYRHDADAVRTLGSGNRRGITGGVL